MHTWAIVSNAYIINTYSPEFHDNEHIHTYFAQLVQYSVSTYRQKKQYLTLIVIDLGFNGMCTFFSHNDIRLKDHVCIGQRELYVNCSKLHIYSVPWYEYHLNIFADIIDNNQVISVEHTYWMILIYVVTASLLTGSYH